MYGDDEEEKVVSKHFASPTKAAVNKGETDDIFGPANKGPGLDHTAAPSTTTTTTTTATAAAAAVVTTTVPPKAATKSYDDDNGDDYDDYDNDDFDDVDNIEMGEDIVSPPPKATRHDDDHADNAETDDEIAALQRELEELEHQEAILSKELSMR